MKNKWFVIPGYKLYGITKDGRVKNMSTGREHKGSVTGSGYLSFHLINDNGIGKVEGLHRLLAFAFIPNPDPEKTYVNHKDGNKNNNHVKNLEWVTCLENIIHSGKNGLTTKCLPITIRNPVTKEILYFNTIKSAGKFLGIHKDAMRIRYWRWNGRVFPEGWQYKKGIYKGNWRDPKDVESEKSFIGKNLTIKLGFEVKNLDTGEITFHDSLLSIFKRHGINTSLLSSKIKLLGDVVFPPNLHIRSGGDVGKKWREITSLNKEIDRTLGRVKIMSVNNDSKLRTYFNSIEEVANYFNLTANVLYHHFINGSKDPLINHYFYYTLK